MDFAKPADPSAVDWSLPADSELTDALSARWAAERSSVFVGSTAWGQRDFVGPVYPPGTKPSDFLAAYARQFNCVELNATFYRMPDFSQVRRWAAAVPADFRFCPKVTKSISQAGDLAATNSRVLDFAKAVQHFAPALGPAFVQLPQNFTVARVDVLRELLDRWPPTLRLAVELRHESWFATEQGLDLFAELGARGFGAVITDVGGRRDAAHMHVTADYAFVRWVGTHDSSDGDRLSAWAERVSKWCARGLREVYFMVHQPEEMPGARSASEFVALLRSGPAAERLSVRGPQLVAPGGATGPAAPTLFG